MTSVPTSHVQQLLFINRLLVQSMSTIVVISRTELVQCMPSGRPSVAYDFRQRSYLTSIKESKCRNGRLGTNPIMALVSYQRLPLQTRWTVGQKCEIYLKHQRKWIEGEITDIFNDTEGEWIKVRYGRKYEDVKPDSPNIRPLTEDNSSEQQQQWKTGTLCEVYSHEEREWIDGEIINTFTDSAGEWLRVQYGKRIRDVMSDDPWLRARSSKTIVVPQDVVKTLRKIIQKQPDLMPIFEGILNQTADSKSAHSQS